MKLHLFPQYQLQSSLKDNSSWWVSSQIQSILDISKFQQGMTLWNISQYKRFLEPFQKWEALEWLNKNTQFGIWEIIQIHTDKWLIEGQFWFVYLNLNSGEIELNTRDLKIWKLRLHRNMSWLYMGDVWVAKIDFYENKVIFTTWDLWRGVVNNVWRDGFITFQKWSGMYIDLETGKEKKL